MTASIINLATYRQNNHQWENPPVFPHHTEPLQSSLRCAEANLVELLIHCALEGLTPRNVEDMIAPPLRLAVDYCLPQAVELLDSGANTTTVALTRAAWRRAIPKALVGHFAPDTEDDEHFLLEQLTHAHQALSFALTKLQ